MKKRNKRIVMMASIILVIATVVSGTLAWLFTNTNAVTNTFEPAKVENYIYEDTFDGIEKKNVKIYNDEDADGTPSAEIVDAYIRAEVVATWQDGNGNVLPDKPVADSAYEIVYNLDTVGSAGGKWVEHNGYYYYTAVIEPGTATDILIDSCKPLAAAPVNGYTLHVEIISQSIQADGVKVVDGVEKKPVELAWGIDPATL